MKRNAEHFSYIQARMTAYRLSEALKMVKMGDPMGESELLWLLDIAENVLRLALVHAQQCERDWQPDDLKASLS